MAARAPTAVLEPRDVLVGDGAVFRVHTAGLASERALGAGVRPVLVLLHGAGHAAMSWSLAVAELFEQQGSQLHLAVVAPDLRGHGHSRHAGEAEHDLAIDTLAGDVLAVLEQVLSDADAELWLAGHSLGGAVAVHVAGLLQEPSHHATFRLGGLALLDAVEGTAQESLKSVPAAIARMPSEFPSVDDAVEWVVASGTVRNRRSAELSTPPRLERLPADGADGDAATWRWRCDLLAARDSWGTWFDGLNGRFLCSGCPRLLVVSDLHHLDNELTVAHMQGRFQLRVLAQCGHAIHEDSPGAVAALLAQFLRVTAASTVPTPLRELPCAALGHHPPSRGS